MKAIITKFEELHLPDDYPYELAEDFFGPNCPARLQGFRVYEIEGKRYVVQPIDP